MKKKISIILVVSVLLVSAIFSGCHKEKKQPTKSFSDLCNEFIMYNLEDDALSAHYTVTDPSKYGVQFDEEDFIVGRLDFENVDAYYEELRGFLSEFECYDDKDLTKEEQYARKVICAYLQNQINYDGVDYLVNFFSPSSGLVSNMSTNFIEYAFFEKEDVDEYLLFLKDVPVLMDEVFEFTKKQSEDGYFMPNYVAEQTIGVCENYLAAETNPMIVTFEEKLNKLDLTDEEKAYYIELNKQYVEEYFTPVYTESVELLTELLNTGTNDGGLAKFGDNGKKYYDAIVKEKCSANISAKELATYLDKALDDALNGLIDMYLKDADAYEHAVLYQPDLEDPNEVMEFLYENVTKKFPEPVTQEYIIEYQNPACEIENVYAYYLNCRVDDVNYNSIKVNGSAVGDDKMALYTTLAHEGVPGHLYQTTAFCASDSIVEACKFVDFIGMSEGWAEYASTISMEFLGISDNYVETIYLNSIISYIICSRLDVGVNYEGWSKEDARTFLSEYYYVSDELLEEFYYMVIGDPGQFLPYTYGHLKMREFRALAEKKLGDNFDEIEYHQFVIDLGDTSLDIMETELKLWFAEQ